MQYHHVPWGAVIAVILKALKMFGILPGELFRMRELIKGRLRDPALSSS